MHSFLKTFTLCGEVLRRAWWWFGPHGRGCLEQHHLSGFDRELSPFLLLFWRPLTLQERRLAFMEGLRHKMKAWTYWHYFWPNGFKNWFMQHSDEFSFLFFVLNDHIIAYVHPQYIKVWIVYCGVLLVPWGCLMVPKQYKENLDFIWLWFLPQNTQDVTPAREDLWHRESP